MVNLIHLVFFLFLLKYKQKKSQPSSSLIPVESSAKQSDQAQQQQQQQPTSSKLSTYSEMDVSTPYADVKQISVQNKPLGGKVTIFFQLKIVYLN